MGNDIPYLLSHIIMTFYHLTNFIYFFMTAYEMKQPIVQANLSVMRSEFKQAFSWIDRIQLEKWTQTYDEGKRYGHMTTNLAECINFVLKGACSLLISALVKASQPYLEKINKIQLCVLWKGLMQKILNLMSKN